MSHYDLEPNDSDRPAIAILKAAARQASKEMQCELDCIKELEGDIADHRAANTRWRVRLMDCYAALDREWAWTLGPEGIADGYGPVAETAPDPD